MDGDYKMYITTFLPIDRENMAVISQNVKSTIIVRRSNKVQTEPGRFGKPGKQGILRKDRENLE